MHSDPRTGERGFAGAVSVRSRKPHADGQKRRQMPTDRVPFPSCQGLVAVLLATLLLAACDRQTPQSEQPADRPEASEAPRPIEPVTRRDLEGLTYRSEFAGPGNITLTDGVYQEPALPGTATVTLVLLTESVKFGDLNGDGVDDAVAVIETDPGGSGVFFELVAVVATDEGPQQVASVSLGDRTEIRSLEVEDGIVSLDLITHGPEDPMCCPTQREQRRYRLVGGSLRTVTEAGEPALQQGHG